MIGPFAFIIAGQRTFRKSPATKEFFLTLSGDTLTSTSVTLVVNGDTLELT